MTDPGDVQASIAGWPIIALLACRLLQSREVFAIALRQFGQIPATVVASVFRTTVPSSRVRQTLDLIAARLATAR
jgi:hypothetical protein